MPLPPPARVGQQPTLHTLQLAHASPEPPGIISANRSVMRESGRVRCLLGAHLTTGRSGAAVGRSVALHARGISYTGHCTWLLFIISGRAVVDESRRKYRAGGTWLSAFFRSPPKRA